MSRVGRVDMNHPDQRVGEVEGVEDDVRLQPFSPM